MTSDVADRVRDILKSSALSQGVFASVIGMTEDALSKALHERRQFKPAELANVAAVGQTTVDWILTGQDPSAPLAIAWRAQEEHGGGEEVQAIASRMVVAREALGEPLPALPTIDDSGDLRPSERGRRLAAAAWDDLDHAYDLLTHGLDDAIEEHWGIDIAVAPLPEGVDACAAVSDAARVVVLATTSSWARATFNKAHEIGHVLAGIAPGEIVTESIRADGRSEDEIVANAFAGAFLMPREYLRTMVAGERATEGEVANIVATLGVSPHAAAIALSEAKLLDETEKSRYAELSANALLLKYDRASIITPRQDASNAARTPRRLAAAHIERYTAGRASARPLANLLGLSVEETIATYRAN